MTFPPAAADHLVASDALAKIAAEMGAQYVPLPYADAASLSRTVIGATQPD